jgi:plastocyanin
VNAFHVIGSLLALWALTLAALGITREDFPRGGPQTLAVGTVSVVLAVSAIGSAIITSALEEDEADETAQPAARERGGNALRLSANPGGELGFDRQSLEARAGQTTLVMDNPSSVPHNISIEGRGVDQEGDTVGKGGRSTVRAKLRPGDYDFYCSVPGHRQAGMQGTLTVR